MPQWQSEHRGTSKHLACKRKSTGQTRPYRPKQVLGRMAWSCIQSINPSPDDAESPKGSHFCSPDLLPLPKQTSLLKRNTHLSSEQSKHESKRSECGSVDEDGVIVINSFFKAESKIFCILHLTLPYHGVWWLCDRKRDRNASYSFPQLKRHKRIHIHLDLCRQTSEKKISNFSQAPVA